LKIRFIIKTDLISKRHSNQLIFLKKFVFQLPFIFFLIRCLKLYLTLYRINDKNETKERKLREQENRKDLIQKSAENVKKNKFYMVCVSKQFPNKQNWQKLKFIHILNN
jgi:cell division protein FtsB